jgi:hypothetical protein
VTATDSADLADAYKGGAITYELAERFGIYTDRVSKILKRHDIPGRIQSLSAN